MEATLILLREGESGWWWTKNYDDDDDKRFGNDYDNESFRVFYFFFDLVVGLLFLLIF